MAEADFVDYEILLKATQALEELKKLTAGASSFKERLDLAKQSVQRFSQETGMSLRNTANSFKSLDESLAKITKTSTVFGSESKQGWNQAGEAAASNSNRITKGLNVVNSALLVLKFTIIHEVIRAFTSMFDSAIKQARQLEDSLFRLSNLEQNLSKQGIDVSLGGLKEGIQEIKKLLPIFSSEDITGLVGQIGITTKELGYTEDQIIQLSKAIAVLNVQSEKNETLSATAQAVLSSLLTNNARGVANLGVSFSKVNMEAAGLKYNLISAGQSISELTDAEKAQIKYAIILEAAGASMENINEYLETNTAKLQKNKAAWNDLLTTVGQLVNNLLPDISPIIEKLQKSIEVGNVQDLFNDALKIVEKNNPAEIFSIQNQVIFAKLRLGAALTQKEYDKLKKTLQELPQEDILKLFPDPAAIKDRFTRELIESLVKLKDTPTAPPTLSDNIEEDLAKAKDSFDKFKDKLDDIIQDYKNKKEDLDIQQGRKVEDLDTEYSQKNADAVQDYQDKVEDINRQSQQKITDIKTKQRQEELQAEREQTNKLLELRQKYLMNLQDALRNRDALQVLKLQQEFEIEKNNLERTSKLEKQKRVSNSKAEIKDAEDDRKRKLEDARIDFERKQRDLQIAKQREYATIVQWRAREEDDLKRATNRRLTDLVNEYVQSEGFTQQYLSTLLGMIQQFSAQAGLAFQTPAGIPGFNMSPNPQSVIPSTTPVSNNVKPKEPYKTSFGTFAGGLAEGGSFLATRPRTINVAETSPELITATPLGKVGKDINKLFMDGGISSNNNSRISLKLMLSRGLEAQLVESAMNNVAFVIEQINGEK